MPDITPNNEPSQRRRLRASTGTRLATRAAKAAMFRTEVMRSMRFPGYGGYGGGGWTRNPSGSDYNYAARVGDLADNSAVAACLRVLCDNFPQPILEVEAKDAKGKWKTVDDHPLPKLFDHPNDYYDHYDLWSAVIMSLVVDGNGYLLKIRSGAGIPVQLWWVPSWLIRPYWSIDSGNFIDWYEYQANGEWLPLAPSEIIHFRMGRPDPMTYGRTHYSWLKSGLRTICGLNEVDGYTASILRNGGVPGVIISPTPPGTTSAGSIGKFTKDQAEELKENYRQRFTGENRGDPLVLTGPFQVTTLGFSPEQLALDKIPARLEDQVCSLTGVNAMVAFLTSGAQHKTYNNVKESRTGLYEDTIVPVQARSAKKLDLHLLGDPGMGDPEVERCVWNYEGIPCLQEDQKAVVDRAVAKFEKGISKRSEAREECGLDFDEADEVYASDIAAQQAKDQMDQSAEHDSAKIDRANQAAKEQADAQAQTDAAANANIDPEADPEDSTYAYDDPESEKSLISRATILSRSAPAPANSSEAAIIAKAMATLDAIQIQVKRGGNRSGGSGRGGEGNRGGGTGGHGHGHAAGSGGQFAPGGGRVPGHGNKPAAGRPTSGKPSGGNSASSKPNTGKPTLSLHEQAAAHRASKGSKEDRANRILTRSFRHASAAGVKQDQHHKGTNEHARHERSIDRAYKANGKAHAILEAHKATQKPGASNPETKPAKTKVAPAKAEAMNKRIEASKTEADKVKATPKPKPKPESKPVAKPDRAKPTAAASATAASIVSARKPRPKPITPGDVAAHVGYAEAGHKQRKRGAPPTLNPHSARVVADLHDVKALAGKGKTQAAEKGFAQALAGMNSKDLSVLQHFILHAKVGKTRYEKVMALRHKLGLSGNLPKDLWK